MQTKRGFLQEAERVNNADNIDYIKVDDNTEERFIYDIPTELFDDISAKSYERIDDIEALREIWSQNCVTVIFMLSHFF